jgi:pimeloyl-ACP methyl ester carboxylesterase
MTREVILVHGLWVPRAVMGLLAARLSRAGFRCHAFGYRGRAQPLAAHAESLARFARSIGPAHFAGHSLGGLLVLATLEGDRSVQAGRVVLLGAPARGCASGERLARHAPGRWLLGESAGALAGGRVARWSRPEALGVIAGTLPIGLGRMVGKLSDENDGLVRLDETMVAGMADRVAVRVSHSAMLLSSEVASQVEAFLRTGRFRHDSA